jgi:hypothetical protein
MLPDFLSPFLKATDIDGFSILAIPSALVSFLCTSLYKKKEMVKGYFTY